MHESESPRSLDDALPNSLDAALSVSADGGLPFDDGLVFYFEEHDGCRTPMPGSRGAQTPLFDDSVHFDFWSEPPKRRRGSSSSSPPDETAYSAASSFTDSGANTILIGRHPSIDQIELPPALFDRTSAISIDPNTRHSNFAFAAHAAAAHSHFGAGAAQSQYSTSCPTSLDPIHQSGASLHNLGSHMGTSGSYSHELVSMHVMLACNSGSAVAACGLSGDRSGRVGKWQEDKPRASAAALGSSPLSSAPLSSSALKAMRARDQLGGQRGRRKRRSLQTGELEQQITKLEGKFSSMHFLPADTSSPAEATKYDAHGLTHSGDMFLG